MAYHASGSSLIASNIREGFVLRPVKERWDEKVDRVILKLVSDDFHLRKNKN